MKNLRRRITVGLGTSLMLAVLFIDVLLNGNFHAVYHIDDKAKVFYNLILHTLTKHVPDLMSKYFINC